MVKPSESASDENLCCFNKDDVKLFNTGKMSHVFPKPRNAAHEEKIPHIIIRLFAMNKGGEYLVQKRSKNRRAHKGRWTDTASGHVIYEDGFCYETIEKTVSKELKEEMGGRLIACRFYEFFLDEIGEDEYELNYIFLGIVNDGIKLGLDEVDEKSDFYSAEKLSKLLEENRIDGKKAWVGISRDYWKKILDGDMDYLFEQMKSEMDGCYDAENPPDEPSGTGLLVGRFQPVHKGHVKLIEESLQYVHHLKIGIGSAQFSDAPENPFSYDERQLMLDLSLANLDIHPKQYSLYPIPDQFDLERWLDKVFEVVGDFDVVITNNLWIGRLFQLRGKHMLFGLKYNFDEYNGTVIRDMIYGSEPDWIGLVPKSVFNLIGQHATQRRLKKVGRKRRD